MYVVRGMVGLAGLEYVTPGLLDPHDDVLSQVIRTVKSPRGDSEG
jgi:hypothetical protein